MRLKYQIFLTLLAASALLIAIMFAISSWSFSRGFLDYVNQNELSRLSPIAERLVYEYEQNGDWDWVDESELRQFRPAKNRRSSNRDNRDQTGGDGSRNKRQLPPGSAQTSNRENDRRAPPRRGPRLVLTDADKNVLVGSIDRKGTMQWVNLESEERIIGYLGFVRNTRVDRQYDQVFADKQKNMFGLTALTMILFSALASIPLAGRIVRPLLKVNKAVDEISSGNYAHRLTDTRRDELGNLANNINKLGVTLEQNRDARQRWIAEISHELRTPLAVMRGEVEAVQDGVRTLDKPALDSLHSEITNLARLVDDLHTLSMSDVGALDYQMDVLDLGKLLQEVLVSNKAMLAQHAINSVINTPANATLLIGDAQRLEQLFTNLLQNTCRYTDSGGQLEIALSNTNVEGQEQLVVDWFDSTPGVAAAALPQLFNPLFRVESSRNRALGGSGLGLSIAKRIVEAHQGSIRASDSRLGGLHITICFPLNEENVSKKHP